MQLRILLVLACLVATPMLTIAADVPLFPLLIEGEPVPGQSNMAFGSPDRVALNDAGQAMVMTNGPDGQRFWGIAARGAGFVSLLGVGDAAPGIADAFVDGFATQTFNLGENGVAAVRVYLTGSGVTEATDIAIVALDAVTGEARLIAQRGQPAAGTSTHFVGLDQSPEASDAGPIVFSATLAGTGKEPDFPGLFLASADGDQVTPLLLAGDPAPGLAPGTRFVDAYSTVVVNGQVLLGATITGPGVITGNDRGLWYGPASRGAQVLLVREGDPVPGVSPGVVFESFSDPRILDEGRIAFVSDVSGSASGHESGFVVDVATGVVTRLVGEGDPVTDIPGTQISSISDLEINPSGEYAFAARLAGSGIIPDNDLVVMQGDASGVHVVAREGEELRIGVYLGRYALINAEGQYAFLTQGDTNHLHVTLANGGFSTVALPGDVVDVGGEMKVVDYVYQLGLSTRGSFDCFTSNGTLAFIVDFADGTSGVLINRDYGDKVFRDGFDGEIIFADDFEGESP